MKFRDTKRWLLSGLESAGAFELVAGSGWRRRRLLILCYHGIAIDREHEWRPQLYMTAARLRARFELIRESGYRVLPLGDAVSRLEEGGLPERSVVLTFDDGGYDFFRRARPVLEEFGFPATVYLTTYYCIKRAPLFTLMCRYLLWLGSGRQLLWTDETGVELELDLTTAEGRRNAAERFFYLTHGREDAAKQELLSRLASALEVDYEGLLESRFLQLMTPEEVAEVARAGVDIQLHTHRHRSPPDAASYREEIRLNRRLIEEMTGRTPTHFCYPSGNWRPEFVQWLRREGIRSATTCRAGLASPADDPLLLPRLVDTGFSQLDFRAWLSGVGHITSRRSDPALGHRPAAAALELAAPASTHGASLVHARR